MTTIALLQIGHSTDQTRVPGPKVTSLTRSTSVRRGFNTASEPLGKVN
jgi:hypothetical protein